MLFVSFRPDIFFCFFSMCADESDSVHEQQPSPTHQQRPVDILRTSAAPFASHASTLKIDLPPAFKEMGLNLSQIGLDALK